MWTRVEYKSQPLRNQNGYTFANSKELGQNNDFFLTIFRSCGKTAKSVYCFVTPVCPFAWNKSAPSGRIFFIKLVI
jgi:hypothetical protein